jgi:hypothetical protein
LYGESVSFHKGSLLDWTVLDVLVDQLNEAYSRGAFRGLGPIPVLGTARSMAAELVAKIVLADVDHLRQWEALQPSDTNIDGRREELAHEIRHVLSYLGPD